MNLYDEKVFKVAKKLAKNKLKQVLNTSEQLIKTGKQPERALADALEMYNLDGEVN